MADEIKLDPNLSKELIDEMKRLRSSQGNKSNTLPLMDSPDRVTPYSNDFKAGKLNTQAISGIRIDQLPGYLALDEYQQAAANVAAKVLQVAVGFGYLDPQKIRRIIDFGAGTGGPTFALTEIAKAIGATVEVVESNPKLAQRIIETNILPDSNVHPTDGITFLNSSSTNGGGYDLVTAFMLGPDQGGYLFANLAQASSAALTENGNLLITSDVGTMSSVKRISEESRVGFHLIDRVPEIGFPNTIILPQQSCGRIQLKR